MPPAPTPSTPANATTAVQRWTWASMIGAVALCGAVAWELAGPAHPAHMASLDAAGAPAEQRIVGVLAACAALLGGLSVAAWRGGRRERAATDALRESERRLRMVGDNLPDTYLCQYLHEADGTPRFTFISAGAARVHGVPLEVILSGTGNLLAAALSPEQAAAMAALEARSARDLTHDFNNILAAMMMQTELVESVPGLPAEAKSGLRELRQSTDRAANLTRQMLLFSRRQVMQPRVVDVNEQVQSLAKMLDRLIGEDVHLVQRLAAAPLRTLADPGMVDQVLMNLAVNARDAMPAGGTLTLSTSAAVIDAARARSHPHATEGRFVCVTLADTGGGIAPEHLQRIFEPFFTTKAAGKGTGLGLATAFGIVTQHRGWIEVHTELGRGTTFEVYLPQSGELTAVPTRNSAPPVARGQEETLLLVEDEAGVRAVARTVLARHGYRVLEAADGPGALELWRAHNDEIALLITDMVMPGGLTGRQLAEAIRRESQALRVVYMSGYNPEVAGGEFVLEAGEHFLPKPFGLRPLLEMVRTALGREGTPV